MGDEERKVVGEIVASGLSVAGWCAATGRMGRTKAYRILYWFRESARRRSGPARRPRASRAAARSDDHWPPLWDSPWTVSQ